MSITPYLRTPFTDLTGCMLNSQMDEQCAKFEMRMMECLEAYGAQRGEIKCADLISDFRECSTREKQHKRIIEMRDERNRQFRSGERKEHYAPGPKEDSF